MSSPRNANNTGTIPIQLSQKSQQGILEYAKLCLQQFNHQWNLRERMQEIDKAYAREMDYSEEHLLAKSANRRGDKNRFQNVTIPVVMPQVESAVTYQASVFLTGTPLFGVAAAPAFEDEALQMESVIDDQATRGGWAREITMFFRDGFKYNLSALEVSWAREITWVPETDLKFAGGRIAKPKQVLWEGNKVRRWDIYNTFFDTRVAPAEMHIKGDFVGTTELMSRIRLKQFISSLPDVRIENIKAAFESGMGAINFGSNGGDVAAYYVPQVNPRVFLDPHFTGAFNWEAWAGISGVQSSIQYKNMYQVTTLYARIMPSDFNVAVPERNTPQVWKFVFVNHQVLLYAERQTNAHNLLPVLFGQPLEDGLMYQTKSLADNVSPIQDITSALSNSLIAARRRAISDRTLYDPSRVTEAHINNPNPSAKIPVRPSAYGKPVSEAVYPFPFRDDQAPYIQQQMQQYGAMANMISGQNPVRQGQFVKGNKTQSEFDTVMGNANGRDQLTAIGYETQIFTPMKEILKINILQYQGGTSLYNREKKRQVNIDPVALRKAVLNFKVSDGLTPTDKLMDTDTLVVALQQVGTSPVIGAGYNVPQLFSYLMKIKGADISAFEKSPQQVAYEQAMQQYQQMVLQIYKQNPDQDPSKLPPQPLPQNYGYDPAQKAGTDSSVPATNDNDGDEQQQQQ
jgi:hypothetical protein